jgi:hypothetical protein
MSEMARELARAIAARKALLQRAKDQGDRHLEAVVAGELADLRDLARRHEQSSDVRRTPYDPR